MRKGFVWDFWAHRYEHLWVQRYSLQPTRRRVMKALLDRWSGDASLKVLDVGCGIGELLGEIDHSYPKATLQGLDVSEAMLKRAQKRLPSALFHHAPVEVLSGARSQGVYHVITCTHSLPYYKDPARVLKSLAMHLEPGGRLIVAFACGDSLYDHLALFFVKFTTGIAKYPSRNTFRRLLGNTLMVEEESVIRERCYMPSIAFFVLKKREGQEVERRAHGEEHP